MMKESIRWDIFFSMIFIVLGNWWMFYFPMILELPLMQEFRGTSVQIGYLIAAYSLPNLILPPFLGVYLNTFSVGFSSLTANALTFVSSIVAFVGIYLNNFPILIASKIIHGIGGEILIILPSLIADKWFRGRILSFSIGVGQFVNQIGLAAGFFILPYLSTTTRSNMSPFFYMGLVCFASCICSLILYIADSTGEKTYLPKSENDIKKEFTLPNMKYLSLKFWLVVIVFVLISDCYFQFLNYSLDLYVVRFSYQYNEAKNIGAMMLTANALMIPTFSAIVVVIGRKASFLVLSSIAAVISFGVLYILPSTSDWKVVGCAFGISLSYSLYSSAIWSGMTLTVPEEAGGMALSFALYVQNVALFLLPIIFGYMIEGKSKASTNRMILSLLCLAICSLVLSIVLLIMDLYGDRILELSENSKQALQTRDNYSLEWKRKVEKAKDHNYATLISKAN